MTKAVLIILASIGVVVGGGWLALEWFARGMCGNRLVAEAISPSRAKKAVLFERSCGATTGFSSQVSVIPASAELRNASGNAFVADGHPVGYELRWVDDSTLQIIGVNGRVFKRESRVSGVAITYE